ncbi:MAG TPA: prenyltransferase/squalene oxidase repeat-containing protein [Gaiellaceae bacterium]|nr:prenyltransferase/squalene oxidase repeat-containing protein [Gaiellaceae bacterium]
MRALCLVLTTLAAAGTAIAATPAQDAARYLESRQDPGGGFAEPHGAPTPGLTAWAVLGLRASGRTPASLVSARAYLERTEGSLESATDVELVVTARAALGDRSPALLGRLDGLVRGDGRIGSTVNSTIWGVIALRAAGRVVPPATVRWLLRRQRPSGGWTWGVRGAPDSNDTAAAIQALRATGVRGRAIARGLAFVARHRNRDGGYELVEGRGSDVQSTAWAIQAHVAAGRPVPRAALRYLARMRRPDGSYRYSARYVTTPVWVTAQAAAALARRPLPVPG